MLALIRVRYNLKQFHEWISWILYIYFYLVTHCLLKIVLYFEFYWSLCYHVQGFVIAGKWPHWLLYFLIFSWLAHPHVSYFRSYVSEHRSTSTPNVNQTIAVDPLLGQVCLYWCFLVHRSMFLEKSWLKPVSAVAVFISLSNYRYVFWYF